MFTFEWLCKLFLLTPLFNEIPGPEPYLSNSILNETSKILISWRFFHRKNNILILRNWIQAVDSFFNHLRLGYFCLKSRPWTEYRNFDKMLHIFCRFWALCFFLEWAKTFFFSFVSEELSSSSSDEIFIKWKVLLHIRLFTWNFVFYFTSELKILLDTPITWHSRII